MASDLRAVRELLLAVAQHASIDIPRGVLPPINTAAIDPRNSEYDKERTINYMIKQLPTAESISLHQWRDVCGELSLSDTLPNVDSNVGDVSMGPRPTPVLIWNLKESDVNLRFSTMEQFGYDRNGYICSLATGRVAAYGRVPEYIFQSDNGGSRSPFWENQCFGKEWRFVFPRQYRDETLKLIIQQLSSGEEDPNYPEERYIPAGRFLTRFIHRVPEFEPRDIDSVLWRQFLHIRHQNVVFQYHMRIFTTVPFFSYYLGHDFRMVERIFGSIASPYGSKPLEIIEHRYSVGLKTTYDLDLPVFNLITIVEDPRIVEGLESLGDETMWQTTDIRPLIRTTGTAAFAFRIRSFFKSWEEQWSDLLNGIDKVLEVDLRNILSEDRRRKMMVDDDGLELSDFYFSILQILRIAAEWIQQSIDDLHKLVNEIEEATFSVRVDEPFANLGKRVTSLPETSDAREAMIEVSRQNWESVISHQKRLANPLLSRIAKKQEEIKSLRDGLFSATSVSEAAKSSQLNHYILVFTVVTIFYLPLGFISSLFALDAFNWDDPRQIVSFSVTMVLVAGTTYCFSGILIWVVRRSERRGFIKYLFSFLRSERLQG
ncbi:hypothetical protein F5X98DRAFT_373899 [Xylaria grammica]|nr:hypothetical protein F5X98DRAFT_373899 [Xylaria grammica]